MGLLFVHFGGRAANYHRRSSIAAQTLLNTFFQKFKINKFAGVAGVQSKPSALNSGIRFFPNDCYTMPIFDQTTVYLLNGNDHHHYTALSI